MQGACAVARSLHPTSAHSHPSAMHEVNRKGIREVDSRTFCAKILCFFVFASKKKRRKRLEGKISSRTHTHDRRPLCLGGLLPELDDVGRVAVGKVCVHGDLVF